MNKQDWHSIDWSSFVEGKKERYQLCWPLSDFLRLQKEAVAWPVEAVLPLGLALQDLGQVKGQLQVERKKQANTPDGAIWLEWKACVYMPLLCQRCLSPAIQKIEIEQHYRCVATEKEALIEDEIALEDVLSLEKGVDVIELLEDELLMALPMVIDHPDCTSLSGQGEAKKEISSPFAVLQALKKRP